MVSRCLGISVYVLLGLVSFCLMVDPLMGVVWSRRGTGLVAFLPAKCSTFSLMSSAAIVEQIRSNWAIITSQQSTEMRRPDSKPRVIVKGKRLHSAIKDGLKSKLRKERAQNIGLLYNTGTLLLLNIKYIPIWLANKWEHGASSRLALQHSHTNWLIAGCSVLDRTVKHLTNLTMPIFNTHWRSGISLCSILHIFAYMNTW